LHGHVSFSACKHACEAHGWLAQIIQVNLTSENPQPIASGATIEFTYSVNWAPTSITFARRFERYLDYNFFEHQASCFTGPCTGLCTRTALCLELVLAMLLSFSHAMAW
jgi:hypothetical protein